MLKKLINFCFKKSTTPIIQAWYLDDLWEEGWLFIDKISGDSCCVSRENAKTEDAAYEFLSKNHKNIVTKKTNIAPIFGTDRTYYDKFLFISK